MNTLEVRRQLFHLLFGFFLTLLFYFQVINKEIILALFITLLVVSLVSRRAHVPFFEDSLRYLDRKRDRKTFPAWGALTYLLGVFFAMTLFERDVALAAMIILAVGDSVAPLVGIHFGKVKHPLNKKKELEGGIAGFFAASFSALLFVSWQEAFLASFIAMMVEAIDLHICGRDILNDNITIPVVAGAVIVILRYVM